jgi:hypothetical protein
MLNLLTAEGLRSCKLADVQRVRFLNPVIDNELKRALEVLALSHDTQKKAVSLSFAGEGKRPVRVGYVIESPIWKTSYRLVLGKNGKPFLQGWAVVENTSDDDWSNVRMALVSGRPISFQMDLYQPLYVSRPVVEPELFASLRPPTYSGSLKEADRDEARLKLGLSVQSDANGRRPGDSKGKEAERREPARPRFGYREASETEQLRADSAAGDTLALQRGVTAAATAQEMGDFFQYVIDHPVNLPRQKSAMLPIVNQSIEGTKVSIYNQGTHAKFPLHGLKFKNTSGLHLMQGPITVFEGASYAGDARIMDLQPNEERLLSYAIDLGMEVEPVSKSEPDKLIAVKVVKGIIHATSKLRQSVTYNVKNRSEQERTLLIEHPFRADWKLLTPEKPAERSREVYRFQLSVAPGKTARQEVVEEFDQLNQISLSNMDDQAIKLFLTSSVTSPKVKGALEEVVIRRIKLAQAQRDIANLDRQLQEIVTDQTRLRANLREMPPSAAAYKRYLEKFDSQETQIEKLQDRVKQLRQAEEGQRKEYESYLLSLNLE